MNEGWKKRLIKSAGFGMGFALALTATVGVGLWYSARPKVPKPWNTRAISTTETPGFDSSSDGKQVKFFYSVENLTDADYQITADAQIKVMARYGDAVLSRPIPTEETPLEFPIFVPAKQKAKLTISLNLSGNPERKSSESDEMYHERLRVYLNQFANLGSFVVFDETNRYQITLPR